MDKKELEIRISNNIKDKETVCVATGCLAKQIYKCIKEKPNVLVSKMYYTITLRKSNLNQVIRKIKDDYRTYGTTYKHIGIFENLDEQLCNYIFSLSDEDIYALGNKLSDKDKQSLLVGYLM